MSLARCPGCNAYYPEIDGAVHEYMASSAGCWHAYGQVLVRGYTSTQLRSVHRLSVDAYAVQHPGGASRQAIQSVCVHLTRLCLFLERGLTAEAANAAMLRIGASKSEMHRLSRPNDLGQVTVKDVLEAKGERAHAEAVSRWAASAWEAWSAHHPVIRQWAAFEVT
jgi:Family of unknown function (DUF5946)